MGEAGTVCYGDAHMPCSGLREAEGGDPAGAGGSVGLHTNKVSQQISISVCEPLQCLAPYSHFQNIKMAPSLLHSALNSDLHREGNCGKCSPA